MTDTSFDAASLFRAHRVPLHRFVAVRFPSLDSGRLDDIVADTFEAALRHPERIAAAASEGGTPRVWGLLKIIAWRRARNLCARTCHRSEVSIDTISPACQDTGIAQLVHVRLTFARAMDRATLTVCSSRRALLRQALAYKFATGDSDTSIGRRFGIRREYLNRAKRLVLCEIGLVH